ncbi:MAG TPA: hypothetical protein VH081_07810 [Solirubrobacteraceae bacterium]|jgi:hypothetical protein|nr:hypothetical protein [Solirubrobacteraceae bacterium]
MSGESDRDELLLEAIESAAARTLDGEMPVPWAGHQLVALVRLWRSGGYGLAMPEAFTRFDLTMADLECFPNGRMTSDEQIAEAAREVLIAARGKAQALAKTGRRLS